MSNQSSAVARLAGRMYAIVKVGGKQYRVEKGDSLVVDRMREDEGATVALQPLLFAGGGDKTVFDRCELGKVKIEAVVQGHERGKKIRVLKFKPKRGYKRARRPPLRAHAPRDQGDQDALAPPGPAKEAENGS